MPFVNFIGTPTPVGGPFTPVNMPSILSWFKADIITGAANDPQNFMIDSSGNGLNGTANSSARRALLKLADLNGMNTIEIALNGFNYCWYHFGNMFNGKSAGSMYFVTKTTEQPVSTILNGNGFEKSSATQNTTWADPSGNGVVGFGSTAQKNVGAVGAGTWHQADFHSGPSHWSCCLNGTQIHSTGTNTVSFGTDLTIGVSGNFDLRRIAEIAWTDAIDTTDDRERMQGYFAHKWWGAGVLNTLDSGHTYKNTPPTSLGGLVLPFNKIHAPTRRIIVPGWREAA